MGVAGQEAVPCQRMDKPKFWKSSTQALSPWRDWEESPESSTASPPGARAAMARKKAAWDQSPSTGAFWGR